MKSSHAECIWPPGLWHCVGRPLPIVLAAALMTAAPSFAQPYPSKPIRFIVPYAPGGGTDIVARTYAAQLAARLRQNVVVDNRPGASGTLGLEATANAAPDGYTICIISASNAINAATNPQLPFDLARDVQGVSQVTSAFFILVVQPSFPARSLRQLIEHAKVNPGKLNYGSSGTGGISHFGGAMFAHMAGIQLVHVPYRGEAAAIIDLLGGHTQLQFASLINANPHVNSGRLRALGITAARRTPVSPDIPTIAEAGVPGYEVNQWYGVVTSAKVPIPMVARLSAEFAEAARAPDLVQRLRKDSVDAVASKPELFGAHVRSEINKWRKLIRDAGLTLQ